MFFSGVRDIRLVVPGSVPVATFPTVLARQDGGTGGANQTSHSITLPAGIVAGELLLVVFSCDGNPTITINTGVSGTNWKSLPKRNYNTDVCSVIYYKIAEGSDALTLTTSIGEQRTNIAFRISGADTVSAESNSGDGTNSDPPLHDIIFSKKVLWIATRSGDFTNVASAAPANYSPLTTRIPGGTGGASTSIGERSLEASSEDPGTFTVVTEQWVCHTIAVYSGNYLADTKGGFWLFSKGIRLFSDQAATVPAITDDPIATAYANLGGFASQSILLESPVLANRPIWNGTSKLTFDGTDELVTGNTALNNIFNGVPSATVAIKFDCTSLASTRGLFRFREGGSTNPRIQATITTAGAISVGVRRTDGDATTTVNSSDGVVSINTTYTLIVVVDYANGTIKAYLDNTQIIDETLSGSGNTSATDSNAVALGSLHSGTYFVGDIYSFLAADMIPASIPELTTIMNG